MVWKVRRRVAPLAACVLACACGPVSVASYPGQTSFPPPSIQPLDLKVGVIPYEQESDDRRTAVPQQMQALGLAKTVQAEDPADPAPGARFDVILDLRGMGLTSARVAGLVAAATGKTVYSWKPDCGWVDPWCVSPEKLARDVAWLLATGTPLRAQLDAERKKAATQEKKAEAPSDASAPANAEKAWWESGSPK